MALYTYREFYISDHMMAALRRYIFEHKPVGHFLQAVICNDLQEAVGRADDENLRNLPAFVKFIYNEAPGTCWGSKTKMAKWLSEAPTGRERLETPDDGQGTD